MAVTIYGAGLLYGAGNLYDRLDALLKTAQSAEVRNTGLQVKIVDHHLNNWEYIGGTGISVWDVKDGSNSTWQSYWAWRLKMDMCVLSNGTIVRVRVGDGTLADRNIYKQEITNPSSVSQWTSWTLAYSGTHYAVGVVPATASTYNIYSAKVDGVYENNVLRQAELNVVDLIKVQGSTGVFAVKVSEDTLDHKRIMDVRYTPVLTSAFSSDLYNYRWLNADLSCIKLSDNRLARVHTGAFFSDPRNVNLSDSLIICFHTSESTGATPLSPPRLIRGFAGSAGSNSIRQPFITQFSDGYYYVFYTESRWDADKDNAISISTIFWQRSKDLLFWTEPVAVGFDNMSPTNIAVVELNGYVYLANNGAVWRRAITTTEYDLTNYVPEISFKIPKDLEEGEATIRVANPAGIHDAIKQLSDRPIQISAGLRCADGVYRYAEFGEWWVDEVNQELNYNINRLEIKAYDIAKRLDNELRDIYNFPGQVVWSDWAAGKRNKLFNYYIRGGKPSIRTVGATKYYYVYRVQRSQWTLYTGWKGHNFDLSIRFRGGTLAGKKWGLVYRYKDTRNYYWAHIYGTTLYLSRNRDGVWTVLSSYAIGSTLSGPTIKVVTRFSKHYVYLNGTLRITHTETVPSVNPGYVGVRYYSATVHTYGCDNFEFSAWETPYTTDDMVKTALCMADLHEHVVAAGEDTQLAIVWGPQTDLNSPAAALSNLLSQYKLQIAWRNGTIYVGQFKETTVSRTIENDSLEFQLVQKTGKRINLASVDGQEDSFIDIDGTDTRTRGRQIVAYFDVPELDTTESVVERAAEEIRKGVIALEYQGKTRLYFDVWKLDVVNWIDNGISKILRIEAFDVEINQSTDPVQRTNYSLSPVE